MTMTDDAKMVTVRCPNHHRELTNGLWKLLLTNHGRDYELKCGERSVRAHGVVLRAFLSTSGSDYLTAVREDAERESSPGDDLLESVLEFLYKGTVTLSQERLDDLQATAKQLDFRLLADAVEETKHCKPIKLVIPRVDEIPAEIPSEILSLQKVDASGERIAERLRLSRPEVEDATVLNDGTATVEDEFDAQKQKEKPSRIWNLFAPKKPNSCKALLEVAKEQPSVEALLMAQKCYSCDFESTSTTQLTFHQASKHDPSIPIYRCSKCRFQFLTEMEMEEHCQYCDSFSKDITKPKLYKCKFCRDRFETAESLDEHTTDHQKYNCNLCSYVSQYYWSFVGHQKRVHFIDVRGNHISKLQCTECNYSTLTNAFLRRHMRRRHSDLKEMAAEELHRCKLCHLPFQSEESLDEHMTNHQKFRCTLCDYVSHHNSDVIAHLKAVHRIDNKEASDSESRDSECDYSAMDDSNTSRHNSKEPECIVEQQEFHSAESRHEERTTNHQKYKCSMCSYSSAKKSNIRRHTQRMHSDSKDSPNAPLFKCKYCNQKFQSKDSCEKHMSCHRKYECTVCSYVALFYGRLIEHLKCVHRMDVKGNPISEWKCSECNYSTMKSSNMSRHMQRMHSGLKLQLF